MWAPQLNSLSEYFRLIAPALWGHGDSPALPTQVKTLIDLAYDHLHLMDRLGIKKFAVVGLSVGAMWGAELAAIALKRVKALRLFDSYSGSETREARENYFTMLNTVAAAGAIKSPLLEYIAAQFYSQQANNED